MLFKRDVSRLLLSPSRMPMFGVILCLSISADKSFPKVRYKKLRLSTSSGGAYVRKFLCSFLPLGLTPLPLPGRKEPSLLIAGCSSNHHDRRLGTEPSAKEKMRDKLLVA